MITDVTMAQGWYFCHANLAAKVALVPAWGLHGRKARDGNSAREPGSKGRFEVLSLVIETAEAYHKLAMKQSPR